MLATWKQKFENSCGAAALMCALIELGINELPFRPEFHGYWTGRSLRNGPTKEAEALIHTVALNRQELPSRKDELPDDGLFDYRPPDDEGTESDYGYTMPSGIAKICQELGITCTMYLPFLGLAPICLRRRYPDEVMKSREHNMVIVRRKPPSPTGNQRLIRVMRGSTIDDLHYLMERPGGMIMDPGTGLNYPNLQRYKAFLRSGEAFRHFNIRNVSD